MIRKVLLLVVIIMCIILTLIGCSATKQADTGGDKSGQSQIIDQESKAQKALMSEFNALLENNDDIAEIIKYVDNNITKLTPENASQMVIKMEKAQQDYLPEFETKFYSASIAQKFFDAYKNGIDINDVNAVQDQELKQLLTQTKDAGFKVDTAEGMFYPIIDYQQYRDYTTLVTPDIKAYIDIMSVESDNPPAKDAALVIGWDEVLTRALNQEKFINTYDASAKFSDVQKLYGLYVQFCLLGTNNTPLFSYDDKTMSFEAKSSYAKVLAESIPSKLTKIIQGLLDTAEQNNYRLTAEVEDYRKNCIKELGIN